MFGIPCLENFRRPLPLCLNFLGQSRFSVCSRRSADVAPVLEPIAKYTLTCKDNVGRNRHHNAFRNALHPFCEELGWYQCARWTNAPGHHFTLLALFPHGSIHTCRLRSRRQGYRIGYYCGSPLLPPAPSAQRLISRRSCFSCRARQGLTLRRVLWSHFFLTGAHGYRSVMGDCFQVFPPSPSFRYLLPTFRHAWVVGFRHLFFVLSSKESSPQGEHPYSALVVFFKDLCTSDVWVLCFIRVKISTTCFTTGRYMRYYNIKLMHSIQGTRSAVSEKGITTLQKFPTTDFVTVDPFWVFNPDCTYKNTNLSAPNSSRALIGSPTISKTTAKCYKCAK